MSATVCINDGDTHNSPVEACEAKAPLLIVQRALRQDSGGAGQWRGGLGVIQEVRVLTPAMFDSRVERTLCPPWGLHGSKAASPNGVYVVRKEGVVERFPTGKVNPLRLDQGDGYAVETGGGGGFGDPLERPAEQVLRDVTSGYVSLGAARRGYGVVIHMRGRHCELDVEATAALRRELARQQA
ncbi:MAG: hydantoinase B/oxoprolinase family protein [Candidatus Entotheonellia bacterium]